MTRVALDLEYQEHDNLPQDEEDPLDQDIPRHPDSLAMMGNIR
jgi:hypothetical protein